MLSLGAKLSYILRTRVNHTFSSFRNGPIREKLALCIINIIHYALHDTYMSSCGHGLEIEYTLDMALTPTK